jgi:hypothetical protein
VLKCSPGRRCSGRRLRGGGLDLVLGAGGELGGQVAYAALCEVLDGAAVGADEVVVVAAAAYPVAGRAVVEEDAADEVDLEQQFDRAEDGCPADVGQAARDVLDGEGGVACGYGGNHRQAGRSEAIAHLLHAAEGALQVRHQFKDTPCPAPSSVRPASDPGPGAGWPALLRSDDPAAKLAEYSFSGS